MTVRVALVLLLIGAGAATPRAAPAGAPLIAYQVVASYPHDPGAFTQGLVLDGEVLIESTGLHGRSSLREVELTSGTPRRVRRLESRYFGEGVTVFGDRVYQLTWKAGTALVYTRHEFRPLTPLAYRGEGWGLTDDGWRLIMSDGSAALTFRDPISFAVTERLTVTDGGRPVSQLNELERVGDILYANVWHSDRIARIDLYSGAVTGWLDLGRLRNTRWMGPRVGVLNGIAYDPNRRVLLVTGKFWPRLFVLSLAADSEPGFGECRAPL